MTHEPKGSMMYALYSVPNIIIVTILAGIIIKDKKEQEYTKTTKTRYRQKRYHKNMVVTYVQVLTRAMWYSFLVDFQRQYA